MAVDIKFRNSEFNTKPGLNKSKQYSTNKLNKQYVASL